MKWKKGYKVLIDDNKQLASAWIYKTEGGIRYHTNKTNIPKKGCGPLAVFKKIEHAIDYHGQHFFSTDAINTPCYLRIYKCKYIESQERFLYAPNYERKKGISNTVYADQVKLTKRLSMSEIEKYKKEYNA